MTRPIKFRAWQKYWKEMFYLKLEDGRFITGHKDLEYCDFREDTWDVQQFTGLHDKNGKEIYDGDILKANHPAIPFLKVYWNEKRCGWGTICETSDNAVSTVMEDYEVEVIGNIYENSELLK